MGNFFAELWGTPRFSLTVTGAAWYTLGQMNVCPAMLVFALLLMQGAAPALPSVSSSATRRDSASQGSREWVAALQAAIIDIHRRGAGGYSTADAAHEALYAAFSRDERSGQLRFNPAGARPSFCSGAVYAVLLSALSRWDASHARRCIRAEAWQALAPSRVPDGVGAWGWANANGPGFAMLVHELGAGFSFTDGQRAQPGDVMKIWWNDALGARERGHLVFFVRDEGDTVRVWSSHQATAGEAGGFGFRSYPKSSIRRALFTRITKPEAFNHAPRIGENAWLMQLMQRSVSWEDCLRRCGISY